MCCVLCAVCCVLCGEFCIMGCELRVMSFELYRHTHINYIKLYKYLLTYALSLFWGTVFFF